MSDQDDIITALKNTMTHQAEPDNPAQPYIDALKQFSHGGVSEVLQNQGVQLPSWSNSIGNALQSPAANDALSTVSPGGVLSHAAAPVLGTFLEKTPSRFYYWHPDDYKSLAEEYGAKWKEKVKGVQLKPIDEYNTKKTAELPYNYDKNFKKVDFSKLDPMDDMEDVAKFLKGIPEKQQQLAKEQGYNLNLPLYKGLYDGLEGSAFYSPLNKSHERAQFFADDKLIAGNYGTPSTFLASPRKTLEANWPDININNGDNYYDPDTMTNAIEHAHRQRADMLILRNMRDMGGKQDQYLSLNPRNLRLPTAKFDPTKYNLNDLLAALTSGGVIGGAASSMASKDKQ